MKMNFKGLVSLLKCGKRKPEVIPLALLPYISPAPSLL